MLLGEKFSYITKLRCKKFEIFMTFNSFSDYLKHLPKDSEEFADTESTLLLLLLFIYFFF